MTNTTFLTSLAVAVFGFVFFGAFVPFFVIGFVVLRIGLSIVRGGRGRKSGRLRRPTGPARS
jgi:hypothetical protein